MTEQERIRRIDWMFRAAIVALAALWLAFPPTPSPEPQRPPLTVSETQR